VSGGPFCVRLRFHGDLSYFLRSDGGSAEVERGLTEPTSVKDVIESCGVPHPEVNWIFVEGAPADFSHVLRQDAAVDVYPVGMTTAASAAHALQHEHANRFVADGHLGKLTRSLRLLGFDTAYHNEWDDARLLDIMQTEQRALLTRDRRLLMHSIVQDGYCPRSDQPLEQTIEVIRRFHLADEFKPFTRCLHCNGQLHPVDKAAIVDQLEPLTRIHYDEFRMCADCRQIFWRGSHFAKLTALVERLRGDANKGTSSSRPTY